MAQRRHGPLVTKTVDYQADGAGLFGAIRNQLHVVDLSTGECRQVTDGDHVGQPAWSPDGRTVAFTRKFGPDNDLSFQTAVHLLDVDDPKAKPVAVALEDGIAATVSFSTDGESLLVVGHPSLALGHAHLLRVPLDGGAPVDLSGHLDRNVMPGGTAYPGALPVETADGRLLFALRDRGCSHLWDENGPVLAGAGRVVSGLSVAGATAVVALATPTSYGEIVALDLASGAETVLTDHGASLGDVDLFVREERTFTISDGTEVQAWLVRDPEREGPRPLLLDVHGGPHNAWNAAADEMHVYHQALAAQGWAILLVNPRGSDGYGAAFYNGVQGAWGVADVNDFLEPIDALVAEGLADADRLAVTGYSYGGFMTCWLTGHDDRFKAAVAGGVVSDLVSMYGASDDGALMGRYELGGTPWEQAEAVRRDVTAHEGRPGHHPDPGAARQGRPHLPGRPGPAVAHVAARAGRPDRAGPLPGRLARVHPARPALAADRLQHPCGRLGRAVRRPRRASPDRPRPLGAAARGAGEAAPRARRPARHPAVLTRRRRRARHHVVRRAQQPHRRVRHRRVALPDRLDLQGLDGHRRHAAGRRGPARARRADRGGAARPPACRPRRHQERHPATPAHPHQRHRRRRLHRHRPRRRLPGEVRRPARPTPRRTTRSAPPGPTATRATP